MTFGKMDIKSVYKNNWGWVWGGIFFVVVQLLYSVLLFDRGGNLMVSPDDSYAYIYYIQKPTVFGSFFPRTPSYRLAANFTYLGYTWTLGALSYFSGISATNIYVSSFYWGKFALLFALIYLLKNLNLKNKEGFWVLVFMSVFAGTGAIHGFFWVVPSFWFMTYFTFLIGFAIDKNKRSNLLIFGISFLTAISHLLSIPMAIYWILIVIWKLKKNEKFGPNMIKVVSSYLFFIACFFVTQLLVDYVDIHNIMPNINNFANSSWNKADIVDLSKINMTITVIPKAFLNTLERSGLDKLLGLPVTENDILLKISSFEGLNRAISKVVPSFMIYAHVIVGGYLSFVLLTPTILIWWLLIKKMTLGKSRDYFYLTNISLTAAAFFIWHRYGFRILWLTIPLYYGLIGMAMANIHKLGRSFRPMVILLGLITLVLIFRFNLNNVLATAKLNQETWDPLGCFEFINNRTTDRAGDLYFTSQTSFNTFLGSGFANWVLKSFDGVTSIKLQIGRREQFFIIDQNKSFVGGADYNWVDNPIDEAKKVTSGWSMEKYQCGYFSIYHFVP